jgi:hypothetical protein
MTFRDIRRRVAGPETNLQARTVSLVGCPRLLIEYLQSQLTSLFRGNKDGPCRGSKELNAEFVFT